MRATSSKNQKISAPACRTPIARQLFWVLAVLLCQTSTFVLSQGGVLPSKWDGPFDQPLVTAAATVLVDGRILGWSAGAKASYGGRSGRTWTTIFDPVTKQSIETMFDTTGHDMFCPGTAILEDGRVMVSGGSTTERVSIFDAKTDTWTRGASMNKGRGYHAMTVLADGSVFTFGGSWRTGFGLNERVAASRVAEVWDVKENKWNAFPGIPVTRSFLAAGLFTDAHMWFFTAPNGKVFHAGPSRRMHWFDLTGEGSSSESEYRGESNSQNGNAVMYDIGKILTIGGGNTYTGSPGKSETYVIDLNNGEDVSVKRVGDLNTGRMMCNSVVLPSGEVVVIGGMTTGVLFTDTYGVRKAEIWSPETEQWTELAAMTNARNYHSVALLMKDGRVWAAGGGLCGTGCRANHPDGEILTPPYLLNADGSDATRPVITSFSSLTFAGGVITVTMDSPTSHTFSIVRLGAATHSVNNDNRRIPLSVISQSNGTFRLQVPANTAVSLPGSYFLFAMNEAGVPSIGEAVTVSSTIPVTQSPTPGPTPFPTTLAPVTPLTLAPVPATAPATATFPTRQFCNSLGTFCGNGGTCCGSLTCQNTNNGPTCLFEPVAPPVVPPPVPICQTRGRGCGDGTPCCGGLTCQATNFGNLCRPPRIIQPPTGTCQSRGRGCGNGVTCCSGLACQSTNFGNLCRPGRVPVPPPPVPVPLPPVGATFDTVIFLAGPSCANIVSQLDNGVTLFAPTDAAFEAFLSSTGFTTDFLCGNEGVDSLRSILTYHAIPGSITGRDILALRPNVVQFDSLQSETLKINTVNLAVNGIKISFPDARSTPYVLHGIDGVLTPPSLPIPPKDHPVSSHSPTRTSCVGRARSCANGETCCGTLVCRDTNFGRLCRP